MSEAAETLEAAGSDTPKLDAEVLLAAALGVDRAALYADPSRGLDMDEALSFDDMMRRRVRREPVAYILGRAHFRQLELVVDHRVLVPRPETELLVDLAENGQRVLDVGTGSGAIALAIAQERQGVRVTGIDNSPDAIDVARENAERNALDVEFMIADLIVGGPYDLIVSNPPYVRETRMVRAGARDHAVRAARGVARRARRPRRDPRPRPGGRGSAGARRPARRRGRPGPVAGGGGAVREGGPARGRDRPRPGGHPAGGDGDVG